MKTAQDTNFLDEQSNSTPGRVKDFLVFVLRNFYWFLLCAVIGGGLGYYLSRRQPYTYSSSAKILLKMSGTNRNGASEEASIMNGIAQSFYYSPFTTTINNEIMIIKSKNSLLDVVRRLNLNVTYTTTSKLVKRPLDFYGVNPFTACFEDLGPDDYACFDCTLGKDSTFVLSIPGCQDIHGMLDRTIDTPYGRLCLRSTGGLYEGYLGIPITVTHEPEQTTADRYRSAVDVSRDDEKNTILNLSMTDRSAERAADVLNTLIAVYNDDSVKDKTRIIENTYEFINQRIAQLDHDLGIKESQLASFKRANSIISLSSLGESSVAKKELHSEEATRLASQISLAKYTQAILSTSTEYSPLMVAFDDATIAAEVSKYNESAIRLNRYTGSGASQNPMVKSLNSELQIMRGNITTMLSTYIQTLGNRLADARKAESNADKEISAVPEKQIYASDIERLQEVKSALYLTLLGKREELIISQPSIEASARIIDEARINASPVAPDTRHDILFGLLLGLMIPVGVYFLVRVFDTTVRYRKDIEDATTVPFIGEVPSKGRKDTRAVVMVNNNRDTVSEAFRLLRSNIIYLKSPDKQSVVFLMASMMENSGKTFVVANLAASFAIAGKKVVVVDLDLRKGTLTINHTGSTRGNGVSDWLTGQVKNIDEIIVPDGISPGADLVPSGILPPNPAELLMNPALESLVATLRERYEYIFLDCVPSNVVADSDIVKRVVDSTVFVVRSGRFDKRDLPGLQYIYESKKYPSMGIVLNAIKIRRSRHYGYGYGYGSGYGYGYGYGYGSGYGYGYGSKKGKGYGYGNDGKHSGKKKSGSSKEKKVKKNEKES